MPHYCSVSLIILRAFKRCLSILGGVLHRLKNVPPVPVAVNWSEGYALAFKRAMDDDWGTPEVKVVLFDLANEVNKSASPDDSVLFTGRNLGACSSV